MSDLMFAIWARTVRRGVLQARIQRLVFGCLDAKAGAVESLFARRDDARLNYRLPVAGWRVGARER